MSALAPQQVDAPFRVVVDAVARDHCEIAVVGELDLVTAPRFRAAITDMIAALPGRCVVSAGDDDGQRLLQASYTERS